MFKPWRSEKNKIKAVFRLQFQATQVPQSKRTKFTISLVPEDVGKPTVRLEKVKVQDGTCIWENPIYETVKLTRESKTGKLNDRIYYFILSSGSSKSGFVGEVGINFADFVEATVPAVVSLPLTTSDTGALLHVTIQKMQGDMDPREPCGDGDLGIKLDSQDGSLENQMLSSNTDVNGSHHSAEDEYLDETAYHNAESNGSFKDGSSSKNTSVHHVPTDSLSNLRRNSTPRKETNNNLFRRSNTGWSVGSASDGSMAESMNSSDYMRDGLEETQNCSTEKPKNEMVNSARKAELLELELQTLRKQVVKESKKGQDLLMKNVWLKEERDAYKKECEQLKLLQNNCKDKRDFSDKSQQGTDKSEISSEAIRKELKFEKRLNTKLRSQLNRTQDSNSELVLVVKDLKKMLEQKRRDTSHFNGKAEANGLSEEILEKVSICKSDEDEEELHELVATKDADFLKQKIAELSNEIERCRKERDKLENHMEQLVEENQNLKIENHDLTFRSEEDRRENRKMQNESSVYLATIKQLESQIEVLRTEDKKRELEFEKSLNTIEELVNQVRDSEIELETQRERFEEDTEAMTQTKIELEQRAIQTEEALKKARQNHTITAERLQEEFSMLSAEMALKFDETERLSMKAQTEATELRLQKSSLEERLQKTNEELGLFKDQHQVELQELSNQTDAKLKQIEKLSAELDKKSMELDYAKQRNAEDHEAFSMQIKMLRDDIEKLTRENNDLLEQAVQKEKWSEEVEQLKEEVEEKEKLIQKSKKERNILESKFSSARTEAEKSSEDLKIMRCSKEEGDATIGHLLSELEKLKDEHNELRCCLQKEESEKENLQRQVIQLKCDLQKKEEAIFSVEKKLKQNSVQDGVPDVTKMTSRNNKSSARLQDSQPQEVASLKKKVKMLEEQIKLKEAALVTSSNSFQGKEKILKSKIKELEISIEQLRHSEGSKKQVKQAGNGNIPNEELTLLKERNKVMEAELKEMEERYSEISLKFAEVEGERQQLVMAVRNLKNGKKT